MARVATAEQVNSSDIGGVQSKVAVMFLAMLFPGVVNLNTAKTTVFELRAVYYRCVGRCWC